MDVESFFGYCQVSEEYFRGCSKYYFMGKTATLYPEFMGFGGDSRYESGQKKQAAQFWMFTSLIAHDSRKNGSQI